MELDEFIENVSAQFENTDADRLTANTKFKELEEWSSLIALSLALMIDEKYDVVLSGTDVKGVTTIAQLFEVVKAKKEE